MEKCKWCLDGGLMEKYHDDEWGSIVHDDYKHFEYLTLESMQCGLSWAIIIKKREAITKSFENFDFYKIASYNDNDIDRIYNTPNMLKSTSKIKATIHNANCFINIINQYGSFDNYIWSFTNKRSLVYKKHHLGFFEAKNDLSNQISDSLRKHGFKFIGSVTIYSYLQACGIINDHEINCFKYTKLLNENNCEIIE